MLYCKIRLYQRNTERHVISRETVNRGPVNRGITAVLPRVAKNATGAAGTCQHPNYLNIYKHIIIIIIIIYMHLKTKQEQVKVMCFCDLFISLFHFI